MMAYDANIASGRLRLTLAGLMGVVLFFALGFAALRGASELAASATFTFALALMSAAILGVVACRGRSRIACLGFAVFGWAYLITGFQLFTSSPAAPRLLPVVILDLLFGSIHPLGQVSLPPGMAPERRPLRDAVITAQGRYLEAGQSLGAIAFAAVGAVTGYALASRRKSSEERKPREAFRD
jgi:hypothetical protein